MRISLIRPAPRRWAGWRGLALAVAMFAGMGLATPGSAQIPISDSGFTLSGTGTYASDYVSRGLSQTRSRMAYQAQAELAHESGLYVGAFISNVRFAYADARQEIDLDAGFRFSRFGFDFDVGLIGTFYPGYAIGRGSDSIDYGEGYLRMSRDLGAVTVAASVNVSPNYFAATGLGVYLETGLDWDTGFWGLTLSPRFGYQFIEKNTLYGTPDYAWWGLQVSRDFVIENVGTVTGSFGYYDTNIRRSNCVAGPGISQDTCSPRVLGSIAFKF